MPHLSTWLRIGGVLGFAALTGPVVAFLAGQEPAEAHDTARQELGAIQPGPLPPTLSPVRVVYNAPSVSRADQTRPPAALPPAASPKTHTDRAPAQPSTDGGLRADKPPLRVGYKAEPKPGEAAARPPLSTNSPVLLDLNRASAEELDMLPGAGRISKAVIRGRPYGAPDDLVRKRILTRDSFARIKDQVAVR